MRETIYATGSITEAVGTKKVSAKKIRELAARYGYKAEFNDYGDGITSLSFINKNANDIQIYCDCNLPKGGDYKFLAMNVSKAASAAGDLSSEGITKFIQKLSSIREFLDLLTAMKITCKNIEIDY